MKCSFRKLSSLFFVAVSLASFRSDASHMIGGLFSYQLVDSVSGYHYRVTLTTYSDGISGEPTAIMQDNPAFLTIYNGLGGSILIDTAVYNTSFDTVYSSLTDPCGFITPPDYLTLKRTFVKDYTLPGCSSGYVITYQRCCRNAALTNIVDPGNAGVTYYCTIPPSSLARYNNSAIFSNEAPQFARINLPFVFDCSAADADGDSLSYGFTPAINCCVGTSSVKPYAVPPPYDSVDYVHPFCSVDPMACSTPLSIDPVSGLITGTPNSLGRYQVAVYCNEWRLGTLINTTRREFELTVVTGGTETYKPFAGDDTSIMVGDSIQFSASGAVSYAWSPATYLSDASIYNPVGHFTAPGLFSYVLTGVSDSGCVGKDTVTINVLSFSEMVVPNAFTPNNDGVNDFLKPIPVLNSKLISFIIYTRMGTQVFSSANIDYGWDGTFHGEKQDEDVYLWELQYMDNKGVGRKENGSVTLVR